MSSAHDPQPEERAAHPTPGGAQERLVDLACGALGAEEARALEERLGREASLARELDGLRRLRAAYGTLAQAPVEPGAVQRIALRVRDQVAHEERALRRRAAPRPFGLSLKAGVRLLLASLAVHVVLLGWIVFKPGPGPTEATRPRVDVAIVPPHERLVPEAPEPFDPLDLGPVVAAEQIPDSVLVDVGLALDVPAPHVRVAEHPQPVQLEMLARSRAGVRSARLARAGSTAREATAVVARGVGALAGQQRPDGSFPLDLTVPPDKRGGLGSTGVTALATLPFLAEGRRSASVGPEPADPVVSRAIAWLRASLASGAPLAADDLALGLIALCEDYMLSYGRLPPAETASRGREIAALVGRLTALQRPDGSFLAAGGGGGSLLWPLLALDAAGHTGLAVTHQAAGERLMGWIARQPRTPEGLPADAAGRTDPELAAAEVLASTLPLDGERMRATAAVLVGGAESQDASVGTLAGALALYRADAQGFTRWNRAASEALLRRLGPQGLVVRGDAVVDTALTLLALQAAYRLY